MAPKPRRRILLLTYVFQWNPVSGNELRILKLTRWLSRRFDVHVAVNSPPPDDSPGRGSKAIRLHYLGFPGRAPAPSRPLKPRIRHPLESAACPDAYLERVLELSRKLRPQVVIAEYVFMSRALCHFGEETLRIIDTHDLFFRRQARLEKLGIEEPWRLSRRLEAEFLARADAILAITRGEAQLIREVCPNKPVSTVGVAFAPRRAASARRKGCLVVASNNSLNQVAVSVFLAFCWPRLKALSPGVTLRVAGRICEFLSQRSLAADPDVKLLGTVRNLSPVYHSSAIALNPVPAGSGLKIKSLEAIAHGLPLVSFDSGIEGLDLPRGAAPPFVTARNWKEFAARAAELLENPRLRQRMRAAGLRYTANQLSERQVHRELDKLLKKN